MDLAPPSNAADTDGPLFSKTAEREGVFLGFRYWHLVALALLILAMNWRFTLGNLSDQTADREMDLRIAYEYYSGSCSKDCLYVANYTPLNYSFHDYNPESSQQYALEGKPATVQAFLEFESSQCGQYLVGGLLGSKSCYAVFSNSTPSNSTWVWGYDKDWTALK